jgi:hypothetical protein
VFPRSTSCSRAARAMPLGRQRDHTVGKVERRMRKWILIGSEMSKRRANVGSAFSSTSALYSVMILYAKERENYTKHLTRSKRLSISDFSFNFNRLSDSDCLSLFRFCKCDVLKMVTAISWPEHIFASKRNRYSVNRS